MTAAPIFTLASRCPRLARARDGYLAEQVRKAARERRMKEFRAKLAKRIGAIG